MELDWCFTCGRKTPDNEPYCSKMCQRLDSPLPQSLPIRLPSRRRSFDLPSSKSLSPPSRPALPPPRRTAHPSTSVGFPDPLCSSHARFRDDELREHANTIDVTITSRWTVKDRAGILVWAHAVSPGLDEHAARPPPLSDPCCSPPALFPLTAQNLAPPSLSLPHVLLSYTSRHPSSPPSLSQDDASLFTPATESVITPSVLDSASRPRSPLVSRFVTKVCSWIAPQPPLHASPRSSASSTPVHHVPASIPDTDATDLTRSSAIKCARSPKRTRSRVYYDIDAA